MSVGASSCAAEEVCNRRDSRKACPQTEECSAADMGDSAGADNKQKFPANGNVPGTIKCQGHFVSVQAIQNDNLSILRDSTPKSRSAPAQGPFLHRINILEHIASKPLPLFTGLSNFNLELCAFAQAITVGDEDIDTATEQLKESSKAILP